MPYQHSEVIMASDDRSGVSGIGSNVTCPLLLDPFDAPSGKELLL